ncbi:proteasome endopeptidase complex [Malassezia caprae]|uniref:Proteasome subunit beta n=1 Tax=Malassezia caprae TaxID=1381934 RepID=A0AAF0E6Q7_9BASI|nr:proteasome endopeptidase complex [Malassezia caprae]
MECLFGITGKGFAIIASDGNAARSIVKMKSDEDKQRAAASWIRTQLAESIRSRSPYQVNLLLGGYDAPTAEPALYWVDYLGTMATVPFAAHGYASYLTLSTMDRYHRPDMTLDEAMDLLRKCINEMRTRFVIDVGNFHVRVIDANGVHEVAL